MLIFQSTLPRRERPTAAGSLLLPFDFNPRSRKGSDNISALKILKQIISIHAPAKGATAILHKKFVYFYTIPTINI